MEFNVQNIDLTQGGINEKVAYGVLFVRPYWQRSTLCKLVGK
jgi:hypothetical protein